MKRDSNSLNKGKIIPFPGLKERYFEKGLEALAINMIFRQPPNIYLKPMSWILKINNLLLPF